MLRQASVACLLICVRSGEHKILQLWNVAVSKILHVCARSITALPVRICIEKVQQAELREAYIVSVRKRAVFKPGQYNLDFFTARVLPVGNTTKCIWLDIACFFAVTLVCWYILMR